MLRKQLLINAAVMNGASPKGLELVVLVPQLKTHITYSFLETGYLSFKVSIIHQYVNLIYLSLDDVFILLKQQRRNKLICLKYLKFSDTQYQVTLNCTLLLEPIKIKLILKPLYIEKVQY